MITLTDHQMAFVQGLLVFILANIGTSIGQVPLIVNGTLNVSYLILTLLPAIGTAALVYTRSHPQEADAALQDTLAALQTYLAVLQQQQQQQQQAAAPNPTGAWGPLVVVHTTPPLQESPGDAAAQQVTIQVPPNPLAEMQTTVDTQAMRALGDG